MNRTRNKKLYKSPRWRQKRESIFRRDHYECCECRRYGRATRADVVHHIFFAEDFPRLVFKSWNLISLCLKCHNRMHQRGSGEATEVGRYWQEKRMREFKEWRE